MGDLGDSSKSNATNRQVNLLHGLIKHEDTRSLCKDPLIVYRIHSTRAVYAGLAPKVYKDGWPQRSSRRRAEKNR